MFGFLLGTGEQVGLDALKKKSLYACSRFERRIDDMTVRHARTHRVLTHPAHSWWASFVVRCYVSK